MACFSCAKSVNPVIGKKLSTAAKDDSGFVEGDRYGTSHVNRKEWGDDPIA